MLKNLEMSNNYLTFAVEICWFTRFMGVTQRVFQGKDKESVLKEAQAFVDSKNNQSMWKHIKDRIKFYFAMYYDI